MIVASGLGLAPARAQPANNTFRNASPVDGVPVILTASNIGATKDPGEPNHSCSHSGPDRDAG